MIAPTETYQIRRESAVRNQLLIPRKSIRQKVFCPKPINFPEDAPPGHRCKLKSVRGERELIRDSVVAGSNVC